MTTFVKELRDCAMQLPVLDPLRPLLQASANTVDSYIARLFARGTTENMIALNGAWACASALLKAANEPKPTAPPQGSLTDGALLQEAA